AEYRRACGGGSVRGEGHKDFAGIGTGGIWTVRPKAKTIVITLQVLLLTGLFSTALFAQTQPVNATIDTSKTGAPISKYIYGQFLEHGGDIVNNGVWSEMLVDRKFFYPVATSAPTPPPVMGNAAGNPRFRRTPTRWWAPIGGSDVVTMDSK